MDEQLQPELDAANNPRQSTYDEGQILQMQTGQLMGPGNALLPAPPICMIHRIVHVSDEGGEHGKGQAISEFDLNRNGIDWFFPGHFVGNPIMPLSMAAEGMMQTLGFYGCWYGLKGIGMAAKVNVEMLAQVTPANFQLRFVVDIKQTANQTRLRVVKGTAKTFVVKAEGDNPVHVANMDLTRVVYQ